MKDDNSSYLQELREALHPDLEECLCEDESRLVDHPLMRVFATSLEHAASLNKMYQSKSDDRDQAIEDGDWSTYVQLHERPHRPDAFIEIKDDLSDKSYWELLGEVWMDTEYPWQNQSKWKALWGSGRPEKQFAMSIEEREALALLPDALTIYRGVGKGNNVDGLSWTLSREKAVCFVRRFGPRLGDGLLITATANKQDVHAFLDGRKEQEVIVERLSIISRETLPNVAEGQC
jgi:hypothetical protein